MTVIALDSNILVYAFSDDERSLLARKLLKKNPVLSVQALNEFVHVVRRKWKRPWQDIALAVTDIREASMRVDSVMEPHNAEAVRIADRYQIAFFDALLVATALSGSVDKLYSEDMHDGLVIDNRLTILNPFMETA